jgi:hypothetical protein
MELWRKKMSSRILLEQMKKSRNIIHLQMVHQNICPISLSRKVKYLRKHFQVTRKTDSVKRMGRGVQLAKVKKEDTQFIWASSS